MAEQEVNITMVEVKSEDIIAERRAMFDSFMGATKWGIGALVVLLAGVFLVFG